MIDAANADAPAGELLRQVFQRGMQVRGGLVALLLEVELHDVPIRVMKSVRPTTAEISIAPADPEPRLLDCRDAALQRLRTRGSPGDAADARCGVLGQFQGGGRVVAIAAQV